MTSGHPPSQGHGGHEQLGHVHVGHDEELRAASWRRLWIAFGLISAYMAVEVIGGLISNSLALLADAGHMLADAAALGLSIFAMWLAARVASARYTFGLYRAEVLAALLDAVSLLVVAAWVFFEAAGRFRDPPEVLGPLMLGVGFVGLLVNIAAALVLRGSARHSLNVEGAFIHVLGDMLGSVGVLAASVLIIVFGWNIADPLFAVIIGVLIVLTAGRLLWKVSLVLMQATPAGLDVASLCEGIEAVTDVSGVHDIHVWTLTSGYHVLSAHVTTACESEDERRLLLENLRRVAASHGVAHVTVQIERDSEACEEETHHASHDASSASLR